MPASRLIFASFLFFLSQFAFSFEPLPTIHQAYQFSVEEISLPGDERMGLVGGNYLLKHKNWFTGLGVYGAATGDRGGFFTGGIHLGRQQLLYQDYFAEINGFFGGGGGGAAPQGGGLMLRGSLGIGRQVSLNRFFFGVSRVSFPNGDINSNQLSFTYARLFTNLHFPGYFQEATLKKKWNRYLQNNKMSATQSSIQTTFYLPSSSVKTRANKPHDSVLGILGIRVSSQINNVLWGEFETSGAMSGGIDGFAQVLGGFSLRKRISSSVSLSSGLLGGAAGGGDVDTGGGMMARIFTGVNISFSEQWVFSPQIGYTTAIDGGFEAKTVNLNVIYEFEKLLPSLQQLEIATKNHRILRWRNYRIRPGIQKYTFYQQHSRKSTDVEDLDVDLTNLKLDAFIHNKFYITGQALGAYEGKAGGYAVGFLGVGRKISSNVGAELLVGVAGGGGIAVGSGKIIQPMVDFELPLTKAWSAEFSTGYIKAVNSSLSAFVFNIGAVYQFSQPFL